MDRSLTNHEKGLCLAILPWLENEMVRRLAPDAPSSGILHDNGQSNFEFGLAALLRAGIAESESNNLWKIVRSADESFDLPDGFNRIDLDHLLDALACHAGYVDDLCRVYKEIVPRSAELARVCDALVACSYMTVLANGKFLWTDKFAPWLVRHGEWDLTEFKPASGIEVDAALASIPQESLTWLKGRHCIQSDFVRYFYAHWFEGKWQNLSEPRNAPHDGWDLPLGAGIFRRLYGD
ncbi:MAG: hypothetical protein AAGL24_05075 [Pseudomonadota bacterium]